MNLGDVRDWVRTQMDVDDVDLTDAHLDTFIRDGYDATLSVARIWPWLQDTWTFQLSDVSPSATVDGKVEEIVSLQDDTNRVRLQYVDHLEAMERWFSPDADNGTPLFFSIWGDQLYAWPAPREVTDFTALIYRKPEDWMADDVTEMDLDPRLHIAVALYAASRAYSMQEDQEQALSYMTQWEAKTAGAGNDILRPKRYAPQILGGESRRTYNTVRWVGP